MLMVFHNNHNQTLVQIQNQNQSQNQSQIRNAPASVRLVRLVRLVHQIQITLVPLAQAPILVASLRM